MFGSLSRFPLARTALQRVFGVLVKAVFVHAMTIVTLFSHVGRFHHPGICWLYFVGPLNKLGDSHFIFIHSSWAWRFEWSCTPGTMHENLMFTPVLLLVIINNDRTIIKKTMFTIFLLFKAPLLVIRTGVIPFLFYFTKFFFPWR